MELQQNELTEQALELQRQRSVAARAAQHNAALSAWNQRTVTLPTPNKKTNITNDPPQSNSPQGPQPSTCVLEVFSQSVLSKSHFKAPLRKKKTQSPLSKCSLKVPSQSHPPLKTQSVLPKCSLKFTYQSPPPNKTQSVLSKPHLKVTTDGRC